MNYIKHNRKAATSTILPKKAAFQWNVKLSNLKNRDHVHCARVKSNLTFWKGTTKGKRKIFLMFVPFKISPSVKHLKRCYTSV